MKLDNEQIKAMCMMIDIGEFTRIEIAKKFNVSKSYLDKLYRMRNIVNDDNVTKQNPIYFADREELVKENQDLKEKIKKEIEHVGRFIIENDNLKEENRKLIGDIEYLNNKINLFKLPIANKIAQYDVPANVTKFSELTSKMLEIYTAKNIKYGNSFTKTYKEYGKPVLCLRLEDKLARAKQLLLNNVEGSADESVIDTLIDMANYAIMAVMELEEE